MKKIWVVIFTLLVSMLTFSNEEKLSTSYNQDGVWRICLEDNSKDCGVIFKGNPYKELKIYDTDTMGMYIEYKDIMVMAGTGEKIKIVKSNSESSYLEMKNLKEKKMPIDEYLTYGNIGITPSGTMFIGLTLTSEVKKIKVYETKKSETLIKYGNITFISDSDELIIQNAQAWN